MNTQTKIHCLQCPAFRKCPLDTRLFVNYCGAQQFRYHDRIHTAQITCRNLREQAGRRWIVVSVTHPFLPGTTGHGTLPAGGTGGEYRHTSTDVRESIESAVTLGHL